MSDQDPQPTEVLRRRAHDLGGVAGFGAVDRSEHARPDWARRAVVLRAVLGSRGLMSMDEVRRATEDLGYPTYFELDYYERRAAAMEALLIEKGLLTAQEIDSRVVRNRGN